MTLSLRTRQQDRYDYAPHGNASILHRKETRVASDHAFRTRFARLTQPEERHGLPADSSTIGTRDGWEARLGEAAFSLRGHRLIRPPPGAT